MHGISISASPRPNGGRQPCPRLENLQTSCLNKRKLVLDPIYVGHNVHSKLTVVGYCLGYCIVDYLALNLGLKACVTEYKYQTLPRVLAPLMSPNSQHSARAKGFI